MRISPIICLDDVILRLLMKIKCHHGENFNLSAFNVCMKSAPFGLSLTIRRNFSCLTNICVPDINDGALCILIRLFRVSTLRFCLVFFSRLYSICLQL